MSLKLHFSSFCFKALALLLLFSSHICHWDLFTVSYLPTIKQQADNIDVEHCEGRRIFPTGVCGDKKQYFFLCVCVSVSFFSFKGGEY